MSDQIRPFQSPPHGPTFRRFHCAERSSGRCTWVHAHGELDIVSAPPFDRVVQKALARSRLVIIDLRQLTFIDSSGLHLIIASDARARVGNRRLVIVRGPAHIDRLFALVGISDRLEIVDPKPVLVSALAPQTCGPLDAA